MPVLKQKKVLEKTVEGAAVRFAKKYGILNLKLNTRFRAHWPDRVYFFPDRPLFIEYKAPGKKATPAQIKVHQELRALGYTVYVIDNVEEAVSSLQIWCNHIWNTDRKMGTPPISKFRIEILTPTGERRVVSRSRSRQNQHKSSCRKGTAKAKAG